MNMLAMTGCMTVEQKEWMYDRIIICTPEYNIIESCFAAFVCANGAVFVLKTLCQWLVDNKINSGVRYNYQNYGTKVMCKSDVHFASRLHVRHYG
jgi:hypothetical protein